MSVPFELGEIYIQSERDGPQGRKGGWTAGPQCPPLLWWLARHDCLGKVAAADAIWCWLACPIMPTDSALKPKNGCVDEVALAVADWAGWPRSVLAMAWCMSWKAGESHELKYGSVIGRCRCNLCELCQSRCSSLCDQSGMIHWLR